jgi:hypothetical protein
LFVRSSHVAVFVRLSVEICKFGIIKSERPGGVRLGADRTLPGILAGASRLQGIGNAVPVGTWISQLNGTLGQATPATAQLTSELQ